MNPETNDFPAFDMDSNIIYTDNLLPVEYSNNNYYDIYSNSIFNYVNNYIANNLGQIIYDDTENMIAPNVVPIYDYTMPDGPEYAQDQDAFVAAATEMDTEVKEVEEPDYSMLVCCICDNLLVDRYVTCCDACQREYVKIKSLDNYKY
jgi:hypothetical protein